LGGPLRWLGVWASVVKVLSVVSTRGKSMWVAYNISFYYYYRNIEMSIYRHS